jgi:hypothetical protein
MMIRYLMISVLSGALIGSVPLVPSGEDTCTGKLACEHASSDSAGSGIWTSPYARVGKCGCPAEDCEETVTCRAWYIYTHIVPVGQYSAKDRNGGCHANGATVQILLAATGCTDSDGHVFQYDYPNQNCAGVANSTDVLVVACGDDECPDWSCQ